MAAQWLFCPMLDDRVAVDRSQDAVDHFIWNNRSNLVGWSSYLGDAIGSDDLPPYAAAARRTSSPGVLRPGSTPLTSNSSTTRTSPLPGALEAAGVDVTLEIVSGAPHGFEAWAPGSEMAQSLVARARRWLGEVLSRQPRPSADRVDRGLDGRERDVGVRDHRHVRGVDFGDRRTGALCHPSLHVDRDDEILRCRAPPSSGSTSTPAAPTG